MIPSRAITISLERPTKIPTGCPRLTPLCFKISADYDIFVKYQTLYLSFRISICAEVKADCSFAIHGKGFGGEKPMESGFIHHHSL